MTDTTPTISAIIAGVTALFGLASTVFSYIAANNTTQAKIEQKKISYHNHSKEKGFAKTILNTAHHDITIIAFSADNLLRQHRSTIEHSLEHGISVDILIQTQDLHKKMEEYTHGSPLSREEYAEIYESINAFVDLQNNNPYDGKLRIMTFDDIMTASYIGIDTFSSGRDQNPNSLVQVELYQYHTLSKACPIHYLTKKDDETAYLNTLNSMSAMLAKGKLLKTPWILPD